MSGKDAGADGHGREMVLRAQIRDDAQDRAVTHAPSGADGRRPQGRATDGAGSGQTRHDDLVAQGQQFTMETCVALGRQPAVLEGREGIRIGNWRAAEGGKGRELAPAAFADGVGQCAMMVGKELEGRAAQLLFAHEQQGNVWAEELQGDGGSQRLWMGERRQAVAERAIADLVVVLQEEDEGRWRQVSARRPAVLALAVRREFALIGETFE